MNKILKTVAKWVGASVLLFCSFSYSNAQTDTNNILGNNWSGTINYTGTGAGFSGGDTPGYNSATNTIYFGYTQSTIAQTIAINNALQGSGVQVGGVKYGFSYLNQGDFSGTLSTIVNVTSNTGATLQSYSHNHGATTNWTSFNQTQSFGNQYELVNLGNVSMSITGKDSRFWAGYYGPQVKDPYLKLTYTSATITNPTFGDDSYVHVPLQFGFPFYGRTFTNSWMHSNGVVSFLDPAVPIPGVGYNPGQWAYCCGDRPTVTTPQFSFMIAPLWTDLYPVQDSTFRTEGTTSYQKYFWNNISEISNGNNLNTFSLEIRPSGFIGINYEKINIQNQNTWVGLVGDPVLGQINERYYGIPGLNAHGTGIPNWSVADTPADVCAINPLTSPTCPGYFTAQCTISPLYNANCPGYQAAYFSQQCSLNSLYDVNCPGYAAAYLSYQCSLDSLYATQCPGYEQAYLNQQCSISPLYSTQCTGYAEASAQCSINPLYASYCPNYQTATTQCSANSLYASYCPNYQTALNTCSTNPLSNTLCSGYTTANNACSANQLTYTYCPSYTITLASCSTNPQTNTMCPGYSVNSTGGGSSGGPGDRPNRDEAVAAISSDGTVKTEVSRTGDSNVDRAIASPTTATTSAAAPAAPVQLTQPSGGGGGNQQPGQPLVAVAVERKQDKQDNAKSGSSQGPQTQGPSAQSGSKEQPKTARQEMQEKREAAAKAKAVEEGKNLAENMGKSASLEQQIAVQNVVVQAMSFVPGFDAYSRAVLVDKPFYKPEQIYKGQVNVDNRNLGRNLFGPSDKLHDDLINSQYNR